MAVNKYKDHVWVLSEDSKTRQIANGFVLHPSINIRCIDIRPFSGGWPKVLKDLKNEHLCGLRNYQHRHLVILVDFDSSGERRRDVFKDVFKDISKDVSERVYVIGPSVEVENLENDAGLTAEKIGTGLAKACANGDPGLWENQFLKHNETELKRLRDSVKSFLF